MLGWISKIYKFVDEVIDVKISTQRDWANFLMQYITYVQVICRTFDHALPVGGVCTVYTSVCALSSLADVFLLIL